MKAIMSIEKFVMYGSEVVGNGDINENRRRKSWNTRARRQRMLKKVNERPEKYVTNYKWMLNELGEKATQTKMADAISQLFSKPTRQFVTLLEKECERRHSHEMKGEISYLFISL